MFLEPIRNFWMMVQDRVTADALQPAVADFCTSLSHHEHTDTCLNDNAYSLFKKEISRIVLQEFQKDDGEAVQWTHVAEALMKACAYGECNSTFPRDEMRFYYLNNYAGNIRSADTPRTSPTPLILGNASYTPLEFLLKIQTCNTVGDFRESFTKTAQNTPAFVLLPPS